MQTFCVDWMLRWVPLEGYTCESVLATVRNSTNNEKLSKFGAIPTKSVMQPQARWPSPLCFCAVRYITLRFATSLPPHCRPQPYIISASSLSESNITPAMAALTQHSHKAVLNIISEMTRPIADILGEPPLTSLEPPSGKIRRPLPSRTKDTPSEADILAITRSYPGPNSFLKGGRLSPELAEPRKRPRADKDTTDAVGRKRRREEKPPRPENANSKREAETNKKQKTENTQPRPITTKLTSQPAPRENPESRKQSRATNETSPRRRDIFTKETKKQAKEEPDDATKKDVKEPSRKPPLSIPLSAPPPLRSVATEKARSETGKRRAKTKETESEPTRSSIPRVRPGEKIERKRREDMLRSSAKDSSELSTSSSERRRPRSRVMDSDTVRHRDSETDKTDKESDRREKRRIRERERDIKSDRDMTSDRERSSRNRERERGHERENDQVRDRNRDKERDRPRDRDRTRPGSSRDERDKESSSRSDQKKKTRDQDSEYNNGVNGKPNGTEKEGKGVTKGRERAILRSSVPLSRPDSGRESASGGGSPAEFRSVQLSSKPIVRSPADIGSKFAQPQATNSELKENKAKQRQMKEKFMELVAKCEELNRKKDYDAYEDMAKRAFRDGFELGLTMEAELRLDSARYKSLTPSKRHSRNRPIIEHYRALTKKYGDKWHSDFDRLGRANAVSFFKRSTRKVYFRMFIVHHHWNKDMLQTCRGLGDTLERVVKERKSGKSRKDKEEELPTRKLETLQNIMRDYSNICSIFDGIATDYGSGYEEPGAESYIP